MLKPFIMFAALGLSFFNFLNRSEQLYDNIVVNETAIVERGCETRLRL